jgi:hypothetical protein
MEVVSQAGGGLRQEPLPPAPPAGPPDSHGFDARPARGGREL